MKHERQRQDDRALMRREAEMDGFLDELREWERQLTSVAILWKKAPQLLHEIRWCLREAENQRARFDRKLAVAFVGPSGAGKSSLLNTIAGAQLSEVSFTRPTTRHIVAFVQEPTDALLIQEVCGEESVQVVSRKVENLEHLLLLDTPDTNTIPENQLLLEKVLSVVDVMIAVFPATSPKLHDNIMFLKHFVYSLDEQALIIAMTMVDRIPEDQLLKDVIPDFDRHIQREWKHQPTARYLIANPPQLDYTVLNDERPLHSLNETDKLVEHLDRVLNKTDAKHNVRIQRVRALRELAQEQGVAATLGLEELLHSVRSMMNEHAETISRWAEQTYLDWQHLHHNEYRKAFLYEVNTQWWGPLGWALTISNKLSGITNMFSSVGDSFSRFHRGVIPVSELANLLHQRYQHELYPQVRDTLALGGIRIPAGSGIEPAPNRSEAAVLLMEQVAESHREVFHRLLALGTSPMVQFLFNAPVLLLFLYILGESFYRFFTREYFQNGYATHAALVVGLTFAISFTLLQFFLNRLSKALETNRSFNGKTKPISLSHQYVNESLDHLDQIVSLFHAPSCK